MHSPSSPLYRSRFILHLLLTGFLPFLGLTTAFLPTCPTTLSPSESTFLGSRLLFFHLQLHALFPRAIVPICFPSLLILFYCSLMVSHQRPRHSNVTSSSIRLLHRYRSRRPSRGRQVSRIILPSAHLGDLQPFTIDPLCQIHQSLGSPVLAPRTRRVSIFGPTQVPTSLPFSSPFLQPTFADLSPGLPPGLPATSFVLCPLSPLHPRCLPPFIVTLNLSALRGSPHRPTHLRMVAPCLPLPDRPRPLWLHGRLSRSSASSSACPSSPRSNLRPESCLPTVFPTTDPSLSPSLFRPLGLPLDQPLRCRGLLPRSMLPISRPLLVPFLPSSWSNVASLHANDPDLDDASRLSSPPMDLVSATSGCSFTAALPSSLPPFLPSFPASRAACYLRG